MPQGEGPVSSKGNSLRAGRRPRCAGIGQVGVDGQRWPANCLGNAADRRKPSGTGGDPKPGADEHRLISLGVVGRDGAEKEASTKASAGTGSPLGAAAVGSEHPFRPASAALDGRRLESRHSSAVACADARAPSSPSLGAAPAVGAATTLSRASTRPLRRRRPSATMLWPRTASWQIARQRPTSAANSVSTPSLRRAASSKRSMASLNAPCMAAIANSKLSPRLTSKALGPSPPAGRSRSGCDRSSAARHPTEVAAAAPCSLHTVIDRNRCSSSRTHPRTASKLRSRTMAACSASASSTGDAAIGDNASNKGRPRHCRSTSVAPAGYQLDAPCKSSRSPALAASLASATAPSAGPGETCPSGIEADQAQAAVTRLSSACKLSAKADTCLGRSFSNRQHRASKASNSPATSDSRLARRSSSLFCALLQAASCSVFCSSAVASMRERRSRSSQSADESSRP
mmetsp:Transcript_123671/g.357755  ORF Transcript_123671/g.357755 Transcript_123671/m.357755 type:complete len:459 (-) Transcript_123671:250-1626(-)